MGSHVTSAKWVANIVVRVDLSGVCSPEGTPERAEPLVPPGLVLSAALRGEESVAASQLRKSSSEGPLWPENARRFLFVFSKTVFSFLAKSHSLLIV